jgi:hypothetical protein
MLKDIAQALAEGLDATDFESVGVQPVVVRLNLPGYNVEDMADPVVAVTPGGDAVDRVDRTRHQHDYTITVMLGRHTPSEALCDEMLDLAEEMVDTILAHSWGAVQFPTGVTSPQAITIDINPDDALQERNVWRAVITVTYRTFR